MAVNIQSWEYDKAFDCDSFIQGQGCSKKLYKQGNYKLQAGSWLKKFLSHKAAKNF